MLRQRENRLRLELRVLLRQPSLNKKQLLSKLASFYDSMRSLDHRGEFARLKAKADGLGQILVQCNRDPQAAFKLLMLDHLDHLSEQTAKAISNIKFDKVLCSRVILM